MTRTTYTRTGIPNNEARPMGWSLHRTHRFRIMVQFEWLGCLPWLPCSQGKTNSMQWLHSTGTAIIGASRGRSSDPSPWGLFVGYLDHTFALKQCPQQISGGQTRASPVAPVDMRWVRALFDEAFVLTYPSSHQKPLLANGFANACRYRSVFSPGQMLNERCERLNERFTNALDQAIWRV